MATAITISLVLVTATVILHYELLQFASSLPSRLTLAARPKVLIVISVVVAAHIIEATLYALAYVQMQGRLQLGGLLGHVEGDWLDFFYFSIATFTTLGIGDLHPTGALRLVAGIQSLNGLVLIGWSASFTYLTMEKFWAGDPARVTVAGAER
jgi:hypothetical protein